MRVCRRRVSASSGVSNVDAVMGLVVRLRNRDATISAVTPGIVPTAEAAVGMP